MYKTELLKLLEEKLKDGKAYCVNLKFDKKDGLIEVEISDDC